MGKSAMGTRAKIKAARAWGMLEREQCTECGEAATGYVDLGEKRWFTCDNCLTRWSCYLPGEKVE